MKTKQRTTQIPAIPNPRGNQTLPQPKPATPRTLNGRFTPEFRPTPAQTRPLIRP
jgi:hypothetical protein